MEFFPRTLPPAETEAAVARIDSSISRNGLAYAYWGRGYAQEGARAAMAFGFDTVGLKEIVSLTTVGNLRSRHVMERIGMTYDPKDDFEHPSLPEHHPLRKHVLYRKVQPT
jgi:RimJ/RimL family protein N-acetyltransferase